MEDAGKRAVARWNVPLVEISTPQDLHAFAGEVGTLCAVTAMVPVGYLKPAFDNLAKASAALGLPMKQIVRSWDRLFWPHANAGFFRLKDRIPAILEKLALGPQGPLL